MLVIRLSRVGKKKHPTFRLIVSEKTKDTHGDYLELLGSYDPHTSPATIAIKDDRVTYWISKGAQPSGTVHNILIDQNIIKGEKVSVAQIRKKEKPAEAATPVQAAPTAEAAPAKEAAPSAPVESKPKEEIKEEAPKA